MGYTHCYKVDDWSAPEWQTAWPQLIQDTSTIIDAVPAIPLSGPAMVTTFRLSSDGCWNWEEEWVPARALYHDIWPNDPDEKPPDLYERGNRERIALTRVRLLD